MAVPVLDIMKKDRNTHQGFDQGSTLLFSYLSFIAVTPLFFGQNAWQNLAERLIGIYRLKGYIMYKNIYFYIHSLMDINNGEYNLCLFLDDQDCSCL